MTVRRKLRNLELRVKNVELDTSLVRTGFSLYKGQNWFKKLPIFWRLMLIGISGGSLVGGVTLGILIWQTVLLKLQNEKMAEEIDLQRQTYVNARRTDLIQLMSSKNNNLQQNAFIEFFSNPDFYEDSFVHIDTLYLTNARWSNFSYPNLKIDYLKVENCVLDNVKITSNLVGEKKNLILISNVIKNSEIPANAFNSNFRWNISINNNIEFWHSAGNREETMKRSSLKYFEDYGKGTLFHHWNLFINDSIQSDNKLWLDLQNQAFINCVFKNNPIPSIQECVFINCPDTIVNHTIGVTSNVILENYLIERSSYDPPISYGRPESNFGDVEIYKLISGDRQDSTIIILPSFTSRLNCDLDYVNSEFLNYRRN